jgi:CRP-like cAMP-binding protein
MRTILKQHFPFLAKSDIDLLLEIGTHCTFKNKEPIPSLHGKTIPLYFIFKGMIRGYLIEEDGEERTLFIRPTHTFFTSPEILKKEKKTKFTFEAINETELLEIPFAQFDKLVNTNLSFARLYIEALQENVLTLIGRVEMLAANTPEERYEYLIQYQPTFFQHASLKHIANYLGMTPNSLSRIIKRRKEGKT